MQSTIGIKEQQIKELREQKARAAAEKGATLALVAQKVEAKPKTAKPKKTAKAKQGPAKDSKAAMIGNMLRRKNGCTSKEVLKATGWPAVSMPAQAKLVGVKLKKVKEDGRLRYFAA